MIFTRNSEFFVLEFYLEFKTTFMECFILLQTFTKSESMKVWWKKKISFNIYVINFSETRFSKAEYVWPTKPHLSFFNNPKTILENVDEFLINYIQKFVVLLLIKIVWPQKKYLILDFSVILIC